MTNTPEGPEDFGGSDYPDPPKIPDSDLVPHGLPPAVKARKEDAVRRRKDAALEEELERNQRKAEGLEPQGLLGDPYLTQEDLNTLIAAMSDPDQLRVFSPIGLETFRDRRYLERGPAGFGWQLTQSFRAVLLNHLAEERERSGKAEEKAEGYRPPQARTYASTKGPIHVGFVGGQASVAGSPLTLKELGELIFDLEQVRRVAARTGGLKSWIEEEP